MFENNGDNKARRPLIFYVVIVTTIILLLNAFIFPMMLARQIQVIGYSDFLKWVDEGRVTEVSLTQDADQIIFVARNDQGQEELYKTAVFPDEGLISRLQAANIRFSAAKVSSLTTCSIRQASSVAFFSETPSFLNRLLST